jgi:hypothetical protein
MQPTTHPRPALAPVNVTELELRTQEAAAYVMLYLISRARTARLAAPHWETDRAGHLTGHFAGPDALIALNSWRRLMPPGGGTHSESGLCETRWTVSATVQSVSVYLVAIVPTPARTAVSA